MYSFGRIVRLDDIADRRSVDGIPRPGKGWAALMTDSERDVFTTPAGMKKLQDKITKRHAGRPRRGRGHRGK
jgi:hypothetical protein